MRFSYDLVIQSFSGKKDLHTKLRVLSLL